MTSKTDRLPPMLEFLVDLAFIGLLPTLMLVYAGRCLYLRWRLPDVPDVGLPDVLWFELAKTRHRERRKNG